MDKFKIVMSGPGQGVVWRNGEEVTGVVAVQFNAEAGEPNVLRLAFSASEIEIEGEAPCDSFKADPDLRPSIDLQKEA